MENFREDSEDIERTLQTSSNPSAGPVADPGMKSIIDHTLTKRDHTHFILSTDLMERFGEI
jgi:hypothetical protein